MKRNAKQNEIRYYTETMLKALVAEPFKCDIKGLLDAVEHYAWVRETYCKEITDLNLREEYEWVIEAAERVLRIKYKQIAANADGNFLLENVVSSICNEYRFYFSRYSEK